jgi:putative sigma-54 modulation protein
MSLLVCHEQENIKTKTKYVERYKRSLFMKILISGHHVEITEGIKQSIENKFAKISKHYPSIMTLNSTITVEPHQQKVEVSTNYEGVNVTVNASNKTLYAAIASAAKKLQVALARRKGVLSAELNEKLIVEQSDAYQLTS